jgi:carbamoyltransferase
MIRPTVALYGTPEIGSPAHPTYAHDHCITVMDHGRVIAHLELERYTRRKHDNRLPLLLHTLIEERAISLPDAFDLVVVNDCRASSFASTCGRYRFHCRQPQALVGALIPGSHQWDAPGSAGPVESFLCEHEFAHVATALPFCGPFPDDSLLVHFDGGASLSNFSAYACKYRNGAPVVQPLVWHWDLIDVAELFSANPTTFELLAAPDNEFLSVGGKLMGLASYGREDEELISFIEQECLLGRRHRARTEAIAEARRRFGYGPCALGPASQFSCDIARSFQEIFERRLLSQLRRLQEATQAQHLVFSGGCALNIHANTKIVASGLFESVAIPPCCNDSGLSLGAAAWLEFSKHGFVEPHPPYLNGMANGAGPSSAAVDEELVRETVRLLLAGQVIGIFQGYGEVGPRALGNRSLVGLPTEANRDRISIFCKRREPYRPVAPILIECAAKHLFGREFFPSLTEHMLLAFSVAEPWRDKTPGIVHVDGTARPQILKHPASNPFMYTVLNFLWEDNGIPCLINTSFNIAGQPIVHTPEDALNAANQMELDALILEDRVMRLARC